MKPGTCTKLTPRWSLVPGAAPLCPQHKSRFISICFPHSPLCAAHTQHTLCFPAQPESLTFNGWKNLFPRGVKPHNNNNNNSLMWQQQPLWLLSEPGLSSVASAVPSRADPGPEQLILWEQMQTLTLWWQKHSPESEQSYWEFFNSVKSILEVIAIGPFFFSLNPQIRFTEGLYLWLGVAGCVHLHFCSSLQRCQIWHLPHKGEHFGVAQGKGQRGERRFPTALG